MGTIPFGAAAFGQATTPARPAGESFLSGARGVLGAPPSRAAALGGSPARTILRASPVRAGTLVSGARLARFSSPAEAS